jgi:hypothetical protein
MDELPEAIDAGSAVILTVGAGLAATVTVTLAEALPPAPVAVAVYVVVLDGLTVCVPPPAFSVNVLPSVPVNATCVAFAAVNTKVQESPALIEVGFAEMVTVGAGDERLDLPGLPQPVSGSDRASP